VIGRYRIPRKIIPCRCGCGKLMRDRDFDGDKHVFLFGHRRKRR